MPPLDALREDSRWSAFADAAGITAYEQRRQSVSFDAVLPDWAAGGGDACCAADSRFERPVRVSGWDA